MTEEKTESDVLRAKIVDYVIIAVILGLVGFALFSQNDNPTAELVGKPAPIFKLKSIQGNVFGVGDHAGKVVVIDFWATWCGPCKKQMPALQKLERDSKYADTVVVLSVNTDDPAPDRGQVVSNFLTQNGYTFDVLYDNGPVSSQYRISRIPTIVVVSPSGVVTYADSGVLSISELRELVDDALAS